MTDPLDAKAAALAALAAWAQTSRRELVAAAWHAGNRDISELARTAGCGRQAIYQDLDKSGIHPPTDRKEPPVTLPATAETPVPVAGWRHPHLLTVTSKDWFGRPQYSYTVKPFTGEEPEPTMPTEWRNVPHTSAAWCGVDQRRMEMDWVRLAWAEARYRLLFAELYTPGRDKVLTQHMRKEHPTWFYSEYSSYGHPVDHEAGTAATVWQNYVVARDALTAAYEAMKTQPDNMWRAGLGRIVDCTAPAERAAQKWDQLAETFLDITIWYEGYLGLEDSPGAHKIIRETGKALGLDVEGWLVGYGMSEYRSSGSWDHAAPASAEIEKIIERGKEWLRSVDEFAGER